MFNSICRKNVGIFRSMTLFAESNVDLDLRMLRSFRVLRPLKLVSRIPSKLGVFQHNMDTFPLQIQYDVTCVVIGMIPITYICVFYLTQVQSTKLDGVFKYVLRIRLSRQMFIRSYIHKCCFFLLVSLFNLSFLFLFCLCWKYLSDQEYIRIYK